MKKKLTKHQLLTARKNQVYKIMRKELNALVKNHGEDEVKYSLARWIKEIRVEKYWLNRKRVAEKQLKEIKKRTK